MFAAQLKKTQNKINAAKHQHFRFSFSLMFTSIIYMVGSMTDVESQRLKDQLAESEAMMKELTMYS